MVTKFPVKSDLGEYRVSIKNDDMAEYAYRTKVYVKRSNNIPLFRFKKIASYLDAREEWRDNLIGLATIAVMKAELKLDRNYLRTHNNPKAIEAFLAWNGDMSTKEAE